MDFINKTDFRKQIAEDIRDYQCNFPNIATLKKMSGPLIFGF